MVRLSERAFNSSMSAISYLLLYLFFFLCTDLINGALNFTFLTYKFLQFQVAGHDLVFFLNAFIRVESVLTPLDKNIS